MLKSQNIFDQKVLKNLCENGERILVVRHPILRIISGWNDKFNLNNTEQNSGLQMGMSFFRGLAKDYILKRDATFQRAYERERAFWNQEMGVSSLLLL